MDDLEMALRIKAERKQYEQEDEVLHNRVLHNRILSTWRRGSPEMVQRLEALKILDDMAFVCQKRRWRYEEALPAARMAPTRAPQDWQLQTIAGGEQDEDLHARIKKRRKRTQQERISTVDGSKVQGDAPAELSRVRGDMQADDVLLPIKVKVFLAHEKLQVLSGSVRHQIALYAGNIALQPIEIAEFYRAQMPSRQR
tara:strand:+ start:581 stop:1174 length:594 start_codon:yes stop_codon:yes gene_type:complete